MKTTFSIKHKAKGFGIRCRVAALLPACLVAFSFFTSCSDFINQDSDRVIFADDEHLNQAEDTLYSALGIVNKLQAISDRTILLGELRADLSDITTYTSSDLRDVALFNVADTTNAYNSPADYYAVINNCNYFIAHADTALKNNRNEYIFRKEYAAVKAFRAWTYMQMAQVYGKVPFVTEPILSKAEADKDYPRYDMQQVCEYFLKDLQGLETIETPGYGAIRNVQSKFFYFPIYVLEGDMNLWLGNYREAAVCYYKYLSTRNGANQAYATGTSTVSWQRTSTHWDMMNDQFNSFFNEGSSYSTSSELVTLIPGDSIPSEGNYSQLRNLFNSNTNNSYNASIVPSQSLINLSAAQTYCHYTSTKNVIYPPTGLDNYRSGDLRLASIYSSKKNDHLIQNKTVDVVSNGKHMNQNVQVYRRSMVYMHLAEALNRAGFPRFAFAILKNGLTDDVIQSKVMPYYKNDSAWIAQFSFPTNIYVSRSGSYPEVATENTIGIHSRGCGWSEYNEQYVMPDDSTLADADRLQYQIEKVEDLIMDENALEFAFEGQRFYDLMRVALRRGDPAYLADKVYARRGADKVDEMRGLIGKDLLQTSNWYLPLP
jgi:starch-binding outer membrane protein, SusD/RagB family